MQLKKGDLDGNFERILEKVIKVKLSPDQNLLDMLKVTTQFKQYSFYKDGSNLPKLNLPGQTVLSCDKNLQKTFQGEKKSFSRNLIENPWEHKMVQMVLYLDMGLLSILSNTT